MRKYLVLIFLSGLWMTGGLKSLAQSSTANTPVALVQVLESLSDTYQVRFSYQVSLIKGLQIAPLTDQASLQKALDYIESQLPLNFELINEGNYAIIPIRSTLSFQVRDAGDNSPIELIYVTINNTKQRYLIPDKGLFSLSNSFPSDSLSITTSFYSPIKTTAATIANQGNLVSLSQDTVNLGEVTIMSYLTSGVNSFLGDHHVEINMKELGLIAGETDGDILQVLQAIPGIRSPNGKPGSLNFRGSPFGLNLTLFDDIPIYHNGHFFGTFSPYNPGIVDKIAVYRGTLPSKWGGRVGGLINVQTSSIVPDSVKAGLIANTVLGGVEFEAPITPKLGILFSARANYPVQNFSPKLQAYADLNFQGSRISSEQIGDNGSFFQDLDIRFSDISAKLIYDASDHHKLLLSYLSIQNSFSYDFQTPRENRVETENNRLDNTGFTFAVESDWSSKFSSRLSFTNSSYNIFEDRSDETGANRDDDAIENIVDDTRFNALFQYTASPTTAWTFGYEYSDQEAIFEEAQTRDDGGVLEKKNNQTTTQGVFVNLEQEIGSKLIINAGLRTDFYSVRDTRFIDPRLSLTYLASKSFFLKGAASRAHQYVTQQFGNDFDDFRVGNQFWTLAEFDRQIVEGVQVMVGALYDKGDWLVDLEMYSNDIKNINRPGDPDDQNPEPDLPGDLSTVGADLLIKKRWSSFETWLSYTLGKTEDSFGNVTQATYYDQRHALNIKWLYPKGRWNFALSWGLMTGLPVRIPESDDPNVIIDIPYSNRFPVQHQMDLSTTFRFSPDAAGWKGVIGFSALNLYNRENIINVFQSAIRSRDQLRNGIRFAPNLQVKIIF